MHSSTFSHSVPYISGNGRPGRGSGPLNTWTFLEFQEAVSAGLGQGMGGLAD